MKKKLISVKQMFPSLKRALHYSDYSITTGTNNPSTNVVTDTCGCNNGNINLPITSLLGYSTAVPMKAVPDFNPTCISALTFSALLEPGVTTAFIADSEGILSQLGQLPGATNQPFNGPGLLTPSNLAAWRQTRVLFIGGFNLQSTNPADVQKNLRLIYTNIDGTTTPMQISNSFYNNAINPNQNLINNPNGFVFSDNCSVLVSGTPGATVTLTLNVIGSAGYVSKPWSRYAIPSGSQVCN